MKTHPDTENRNSQTASGSSVFYMETGSHNPFYNLAFEEYVLANRREGNYLLLWQNANTIVVGQNQNTAEEINEAFVREHQINVVRRTTGGGAVYHDLGNLNYSFISDAGVSSEMNRRQFVEPVVEALRGLGLDAEASGRNDILVSGCKVSGTAQRVLNGRILHHGTLLFDADSSMIAGALNVDPLKFRSKGVRSVRSRVGNIRNFLPVDMTIMEFWDYLIRTLSGTGLRTETLSTSEMEAVLALKESKYDTWEWNFGRSPGGCQLAGKQKWDGGILEIHASVKQGHIRDIAFYGDFLSLEPLTPVREQLCGCPYRREDVEKILNRHPLNRYFGSITEEEILSTLFDTI